MINWLNGALLLTGFVLFSCTGNHPEDESNLGKTDNQEWSDQQASQEEPTHLGNFTRLYRGTIDDNTIEMTLRSNGGVLHGHYFYSRIGKQISLKGELDTLTNDFTLHEYDEEKNEIATFNGHIANNFSIRASWKKKSSKKQALEVLLQTTGEANKWYRAFLPFHPQVVEQVTGWEPDASVSLNRKFNTKNLEFLTDKEMLDTRRAGYIDKSEEVLIRYPFFEYELIGEKGQDYYVLTSMGGGGTGIFTGIYHLTLKNDKLYAGKCLVGGDRCNGGIDQAQWGTDYLLYWQNITSFDLFYLSDFAESEIAPDLEGCAMCCVAQAVFKYDLKRKKHTLQYIALEKEYDEDYAEPESDSRFLMEELQSYVNAHGTRMSVNDLNKLCKKLAQRASNRSE